MAKKLFLLTALLLGLLAGCGSNLSDDDYVAIVLDETKLMLEEELTVEEALAKAAESHGTTGDEVLAFEEDLANDPDRLAGIVERIMNESAELRESFLQVYSQALPTAAPTEEGLPETQPAAPITNPTEPDATAAETPPAPVTP